MTDTSSRLRIRHEGGVHRAEFVDRSILDESVIKQIGDELFEIINDNDNPKLILNFRHVDHLSSSALGTLITVNNKVKAREGQLRLAEIDTQIREVFSITKLDTLFQIHETEEQAFNSFS